MADDVLKRQGRMKQAGRGAGCKCGNIFNTIYTLAHFPCGVSPDHHGLECPHRALSLSSPQRCLCDF